MVELAKDARTLLRVAWLTEMEYRANFLISIIGALAYNAGQLLFISVLLNAFGSVSGWSAPQVFVLFGVRMASHSVCAFFFRRLTDLDSVVHTGEFDRYLLRPAGLFLQLLMRQFNLQQFGDVLIAAAILAFALPRADIQWSVPLALWLLVGILAGGMLEAALQLMRGSLSFRWTNTESLTGLIETVFGTFGNFPLQVFGLAGSIFFTLVVPLAFVGWIPAAMLLGREDSLWFPGWLGWFSPLVGMALFAVAVGFFHRQSRRYTSPGS